MNSETVGQIAKALSLAQSQFKPIKRESVNPFYKSKYADLAAIIEATKDALTANGLTVTQLIQPSPDHVAIETMLIHGSGEWLKSMIELKPKADDPQAFGSACTYARRYALGAILGVASEDDDDANEATKPKASTTTKPFKPNPTATDITREQSKQG